MRKLHTRLTRVSDRAALARSRRQQLDRLIAREEILEVLYSWARGADRNDEGLKRSVFFHDSVDNHGIFDGPADDFVTWIQNRPRPWEVTHHLIGNPSIRFVGPCEARVESYFSAVHVRKEDEGSLEARLFGRYLDSFRRRDGRWGIQHRQVLIDWQNNYPGADAFTPGQRGPNDLVIRGGHFNAPNGVQ